MERTPRGDDKYLELVTQEHTFIKEELSLLHTYQGLERNERSSFKLLSVAVRDSHEKERSQGEKTKYYSLIFSLVGVCVGGLISVFTNERRMRKMRQVIFKVNCLHFRAFAPTLKSDFGGVRVAQKSLYIF